MQKSQTTFLENQKKDHAYNEEISVLTQQQRQLEKELEGVSKLVQVFSFR